MVFVIVNYETKDGRRDDFLTEFKQIVTMVRAEKGCLKYEPTIDELNSGLPTTFSTNANRITLIEMWESVAALKAHIVAPHMSEFRERVKPYLAKVEIQLLRPS